MIITEKTQKHNNESFIFVYNKHNNERHIYLFIGYDS